MKARRRGRGRRGGAAVVLAVVVVAVLGTAEIVIGTAATVFLAGVVTGVGGTLAAVRPRRSLRVSTRGTRGRTLGRERSR